MAATPTKEKTYTLRAQTQEAVKTQGKVSAGGLEWDCKSRSCTAKSPRDAASAQDCRALAQQVGAIKSYARSGGEKLDQQALSQCNAGLQVTTKQDKKKDQKTYTLRAETQATVKTQGKVAAAGLEWDCKSRHCSAKSPRDAASMEDCRALAQQVGAIKSFGRSGGQKLDQQSLAQCNATTQVAAKKEAPPPPPAKDSSKAPAAAATTGTDPRGTVRTSPLTFTGVGKPLLGPRGTTDIRINTPPLAYTGTGSFPARGTIAPLTINTAPLSYTGTGALPGGKP